MIPDIGNINIDSFSIPNINNISAGNVGIGNVYVRNIRMANIRRIDVPDVKVWMVEPPQALPPDVPVTVTIFDRTSVTSKVSVADNDNATLSGPAALLAVEALDVNVSVGVISAIISNF